MGTTTKKITKEPKLEEKIEYAPFLAPYEQSRVRSKYEKVPFTQLLEDLKNNTNDAILFIMDKYDPLLNSIYTVYKMKTASQTAGYNGDFSSLLSVEDWKNEAYLYLSGAGTSRPFFPKFVPQMQEPTEEYMWKSFSMYLKHYLTSYFYKILRHQSTQAPSGMTTLNKPSAPDIAYSDVHPEEDEKREIPTDNEILKQLFEKYLFLLKNYTQKHGRWGKLMYQAIMLRTTGKSFHEIKEITGKTYNAVYKAVSRAKEKWLKFLNAHKSSGKAPEQLEKKEQNIDITPVQE